MEVVAKIDSQLSSIPLELSENQQPSVNLLYL